MGNIIRVNIAGGELPVGYTLPGTGIVITVLCPAVDLRGRFMQFRYQRSLGRGRVPGADKYGNDLSGDTGATFIYRYKEKRSAHTNATGSCGRGKSISHYV